ncbi:MAG TPA: DJ-1/PfpI family protein [Acidimicrobiales bacterium]|jgi:transcriptional regulator GlxA family with amidase domain|nr:DJ-1/PfpI family protein [Acidimicrobiales bacterium]HRA33982.1 DJ-1/PfpI family protein [Acidimicrobiales bacterium]
MQIAIGLYPGFTALDAIGPYQVLTNVPGVEVVLCAESTGRLSDDNGLLHLDIEHTFAEVTAPDVTLVPGGFVTRRLARDRDPIVDWVAATHATTTVTTSVCTGALLLGAAGILDGLDATTHWFAYDELAKYGANPTEQRVVRQGKVWTAAGVSAGIDLALALTAELWGPEIAQAVQLGIEYDPQPPFDSGAPSKADPEILALVRAVSEQKEAEVLG